MNNGLGLARSNGVVGPNNFDLLRLLFAATVFLVHASVLSGHPQLEWIQRFVSSDIAVKAFFVVSGFLIFMSFQHSSSLASYARKRIRRVYPAYFTVVMLCAIGLAGISSVPSADYFSRPWVAYVLANLSFLNFLHPTLPGVFDGNRMPAINGALWTIKIEVLFYLSVPVFVLLFRRFGYLLTIGIVYLGSVAYMVALSLAAQQTGSAIYDELGRQLPGQLSYFMAGAFFYYYLPAFQRHAPYFVVPATLILVLDAFWAVPVLEPFALGTLVIFLAFWRYLGNFGKYGDFSYGIYIVHFPIIQCLVHWKWMADHPGLFLVSAAVCTTAAAFALWHLVEKRFLQRGNHYISASLGPMTPDRG